MLTALRLTLVLFALSCCLPSESTASALRGRGLLPAVRAKVKGQRHVHRPNYRIYRPGR
ncbi:hypothetical protein [Hymenobacter sediminis]|uniref:hypothetical protein n=1 Tax=Hymenobacter sediminis TaxID=2218621 RepID=UPI00139045A3|nr:hypothetical protein [Hymenobacter sediminis]